MFKLKLMRLLNPGLSKQELKHKKYMEIYRQWELMDFDGRKVAEKTGFGYQTVLQAISYGLKFQQTEGWDDGIIRYK